MKKTKVIIPALGILLLSTAASVTGTVAWFSANSSVSANGMALAAKSDDTFLLISKTNTSASAIQGEKLTEVDYGMTVEDSKLYASAPALSDTEVGYLSVAEGHKKTDGSAITTAGVKVVNDATAGVPTNWYTANSADPAASDLNVASVKQLISFSGFVVKQTAYLTVAKGANPANNLRVTGNFTQNGAGEDITAAKVIVATSDGGFAILSSSSADEVDIKGSNTKITDTTVLTVNFYIYYDGNESVVTTNNAGEGKLTGATFSFTFDVDEAAA